MEDFLHFVWQNRLYQKLIPRRALSGKEIEVLDTGVLNKDAGADFFNAKIRIDGLVWVGSVEIHHHSSQWYEHKHDEDPSYENVILHIVEEDNEFVCRKNGDELPCCEMMIADELKEGIKSFFDNKSPLPCSETLEHSIQHLDVPKLMQEFSAERFEQKLKQVESLWEVSQRDWSKTLYFLLMRYLGLGINNDVMEYLARNLDLRLLLRQKPKEQEALLLGQAGIINHLKDKAKADELEEIYSYLSYKYSLEPLPAALFKRLRTRPQNFPHERIRQFINLLNTLHLGADTFEDCSSLDELRLLLGYGKASLTKEEYKETKALLSKQVRDLLLINAVVPYIAFSRDVLKRKARGKTDTRSIWEQLPAENNKITRLFKGYGFSIQSASDSQALLHLYRAYCERRKCFFCPFGREALSHKL